MTHSDIIDLWPSLAAFAVDLAVPYGTAKAMRRRNSIPAQYWNLVITRASTRAIDGIGLQQLADAIAVTNEELAARP